MFIKSLLAAMFMIILSSAGFAAEPAKPLASAATVAGADKAQTTTPAPAAASAAAQTAPVTGAVAAKSAAPLATKVKPNHHRHYPLRRRLGGEKHQVGGRFLHGGR
jgi:hypothetical protein